MKSSEINLAELLQFEPDRGQLLLANQRMLLFSHSALAQLRALLVEHLGMEFALAVFSQFGYRSAVDDYTALTENWEWDSDLDRLTSGPVMHMWEGIVAVSTTSLDFDLDTGSFHMEGEWRGSFEASSHLDVAGPSEDSVCASLTGYASGWATSFMGRSMLAIEHDCVAKGDELCRFEIRPVDEWGPEADRWRQALNATSETVSRVLEDLVEQRTRELTLKNTQLVHARSKAEEANRAKTRFLANMSHELRTPMNGVIGILELLRETELTPEQQSLVDLINSASQQQVSVIDSLFSFANDDDSVYADRRTQWKTSEFFAQLNNTFSLLAEHRGITYTSNIQVPLYLTVDPNIVKIIITNLIDNAMKFSPSGSGVTLGVSTVDETLTILVSDEGPGIRADDYQRIFLPFEQLDDSLTRISGGSGLGLAIVAKMVTAVHGTVSVSSTVGVGSTFTVEIPLANVDERAEVTPPTARRAPMSTAPAQTGETSSDQLSENKTVVVADDDRISGIVITKILSNEGWQPLLAKDGQAALDLIHEHHPRLVILDLHMPKLDGITVTDILRKEERSNDSPAVPIIALTADVFDDTRRKCFNAGFTEFLTKPIDRHKLVTTLRHLALQQS